jgi:hypothetical protein
MNGTLKQIAEEVCAKHGHNIAHLDSIGKTICTKCGMNLDEIRADKTPIAKAA